MYYNNMITFILATLGMTWIIVDSSLFEPIRDYLSGSFLQKLVTCKQCSGFWSGVFMAYILLTDKIPMLFVWGCIGSFIAVCMEVILNRIEFKEI